MKYIGIDPGKHTGLCVIDNGQISRLMTVGLWEALDVVWEHDWKEVELVVVEVAPSTHVWHDLGSPRRSAKIGQDVGAVRERGLMMAEGIQRTGFKVKTVPPQGKIDAKKFKQITGFSKRTNPHERDAAMLVWGYGR